MHTGLQLQTPAWMQQAAHDTHTTGLLISVSSHHTVLPLVSPYRDAASAPKGGHIAEVVVGGSGRHGPHCWVGFTQLILLVDAGNAPRLSGQALWGDGAQAKKGNLWEAGKAYCSSFSVTILREWFSWGQRMEHAHTHTQTHTLHHQQLRPCLQPSPQESAFSYVLLPVTLSSHKAVGSLFSFNLSCNTSKHIPRPYINSSITRPPLLPLHFVKLTKKVK
ncbi:hypothetical protein E2C01_013661 [Portunus trituberculatus]|uniref:Uncharacterized protein n=1 Tax=Portunus trituberculatus TaxID=210409 RepID=A0A5B7DHW3_PORTR|nr:hypothetical protein [Portunus trituberculatus]